MLKKVFFTAIFSGFLILCIGCRNTGLSDNSFNTESKITAEKDAEQHSFAECVQTATHIVEGIYIGPTQDEYVPQLKFRVSKDLKGNYLFDEDDIIYISISSEKETERYQTGETYCLVLEKHNWVFYDHPQYVSLLDAPLLITDENRNELTQLISKTLASAGNTMPESYGMPFSYSEDISEILAVTKNIFVVEVEEEIDRSAFGPTCVILCNVEDVLLGDPPAEKKILITVPADTVEPGTKKIVLLSGPADTGSIVYVLASKHSFYSLEEARHYEELDTYMEKPDGKR